MDGADERLPDRPHNSISTRPHHHRMAQPSHATTT